MEPFFFNGRTNRQCCCSFKNIRLYKTWTQLSWSAGIKLVENWPDHVVGEQELLLFLSCHEMTGLEEMCVH